MHFLSLLPRSSYVLRAWPLFFAALLLLLTPTPGIAEPPVSAASETPAVVQDALQAVAEQAAPEPPAQAVQTASALPAVPGEAAPDAPSGADVPFRQDWLLDAKGTLTLGEVLAANTQKAFRPYEPESLPHLAGTIWLRLSPKGKTPTFPLVLDLNTRIADQLPGIPQVWLTRSGETSGTPVRPSGDGLYHLPNPLPDQTNISIRVSGIPGPGFAPSLRAVSSLTLLDELGTQPQLVLLVVLLILCLLRGVTERREWRMWAALYIAAVWVQAFWGLPTTPAGEVSRWDMPGLLAPGVALLILPHVGRHMMRTRHHAPFIDMLFVLLALCGIALSAAPLIPGYTWTLQFLPLWPLFMLLLLPGTLMACLRRLPGAKRFLLISILPPLGMLALFPLSSLLPDLFIKMLPHALDDFMKPGIISIVPLTCLVLSALVAALSPSPRPLPAPNRSTRETTKTGKAAVAALELGGFPKTEAGAHLPTTIASVDPTAFGEASFTPPPAAARAHTPAAPLPSASAPAKASIHPQPLQTPMSAGEVERVLRAPLDALLRAISALDQTALPLEARRRTDALGSAGRTLAKAIGNIERLPDQPRPADIKERFDLKQLLLDVNDSVAELAESKNIGLSWFTAPHLSRCYEGSRNRIASVLSLLAESSVLATEKGMVQIRAQRLPESTDPGHLLFTVSDSGSGMPPFRRSTLAFVRAWELAGSHGEVLSLESGPRGTSVSFSMSLSACMTEQTPPAPQPDKDILSRLPASALRIIVASSVPANRQLLSFYLDELPHEILEARTPEEAQAIYRNTPGALIIFDDDMSEEAIADAVASIRAFEGEHNFPLACILALVNGEAQIDALRRAGCTHFLKKPLTRKGLRHLTLRLAPVSRRFKDKEADETIETPMPKPSSASRPVSPDIPDLPEFPEARLSPAQEQASPAHKGLLSALLSPFHKKPASSPVPKEVTPPAAGQEPRPRQPKAEPQPASPVGPAPETPIALQRPVPSAVPGTPGKEQEAIKPLTDKLPAAPRLSSVGEPMPVVKNDTTKPAPRRNEHPNPLEERAKRMPVRPSAPPNATEWVGEPTPIIKKTDGQAPQPHSDPARPEPLPTPNAAPLLPPTAAAAEPLTLPHPVEPLAFTPPQPVSQRADAPAALTLAAPVQEEPLLLGEPLPEHMQEPRVLDGDALLLDAPLEEAQPAAPEKPAAAACSKEPEATPTAEAQAIPDLFGGSFTPPPSGMRSLLDEASKLAPCEQGSRPAPSEGATAPLLIEDIVELGTPLPSSSEENPAEARPADEPLNEPLPLTLPQQEEQEEPSPHPEPAAEPLTAPDEQAGLPAEEHGEEGHAAEAREEGETPAVAQDSGQDSEQEAPQEPAHDQDAPASDEAIRAMLAALDSELELAVLGEQSGDAQLVCNAAARIGQLAETYDLRVLDDPARCLEEAARAGSMEDVAQLMPDLVSAVTRNRAAFTETDAEQKG